MLYLLRKRSPKAMLWIAAALLTVGVGLSVVFEGLVGGGGGDGGEGGAEEIAMADLALAEGSFVEGSIARGFVYLSWLVLSSITAFNWRIMALFLVGAALRLGWATPEKRALHRRMATVGLSSAHVRRDVAVPARPRRPDVGLQVADVLLHQLGGLALSFGFAGAVATWCWSSGLGRLRRAIAGWAGWR